MLTIRRSDERGHADHGWLDSYHTFSFASYFDPEHMNFGVLRVINQDRVAPGQGFGTHGHRDMEIVSYVLEGVLEHRDSLGNGSQMRPGEVQLMSAGSGVTHSEFNADPNAPLEFLQMWIVPQHADTQPRYEQKAFPPATRGGRLQLVVSPDGAEGSLTIGQDARMYIATLSAGDVESFELGAGRMAWLHVARGAVRIGDEELRAGDGAAFERERRITLAGRSEDDAEVVLWELPSA